MQQEILVVDNVKCGGCVSAIQEGLGKLPGVQSVDVVIETGQVTVNGEGLSRETLSRTLAELGYPVRGQ